MFLERHKAHTKTLQLPIALLSTVYSCMCYTIYMHKFINFPLALVEIIYPAKMEAFWEGVQSLSEGVYSEHDLLFFVVTYPEHRMGIQFNDLQSLLCATLQV